MKDLIYNEKLVKNAIKKFMKKKNQIKVDIHNIKLLDSDYRSSDFNVKLKDHTINKNNENKLSTFF